MNDFTQNKNYADMIDYQNYIVINPKIMMGKPVIKDARITVELILEKLSKAETIQDLLEVHPSLTIDKIYAALALAADVLKGKKYIR